MRKIYLVLLTDEKDRISIYDLNNRIAFRSKEEADKYVQTLFNNARKRYPNSEDFEREEEYLNDYIKIVEITI